MASDTLIGDFTLTKLKLIWGLSVVSCRKQSISNYQTIFMLISP